MINIFGHDVPCGSKQFFTVPVGSYANCAEISIPVIVVNGAKEGPVFWINGEVHGEELNGSIATWELLRQLDPQKLSGTIVATPVANPLALSDRNKISFIDYVDMDTAFPGVPSGTWTQRIAGILFGEIKRNASFLLSFHTLAPRHLARPYTVSKLVPGADPKVCMSARRLAVIFGVEANCVVDLSSATGELPGVMNGALDILCMKNGIPTFMAEMGCASSIEHSSIWLARQGINNILNAMGMLPGERIAAPRQLFITKRSFLRADQGGMLRDVLVSPGQIVKKGELYAETHYFGEEIKQHFAPRDLYIIAARKHPVIQTGERFLFVGTEWQEVGADFLR